MAAAVHTCGLFAPTLRAVPAGWAASLVMAAMRSGHRCRTAHAASRGPETAGVQRVLTTRNGPGARAGRRFRMAAADGGPTVARRATSAQWCSPKGAATAVGAVVGAVQRRRQRW